MAGGLVDTKMVMISDAKISPVFRWTWYVISPGKVRRWRSNPMTGEDMADRMGLHLR